MEEKNIQLERTVFFCDAVVAIAITLLAFNLKVVKNDNTHLSFKDIASQWRVFAAFLLSFFNIANFWRTHHMFFAYIKKMDEKLLWYNICWLLFIITLPFATTLVSSDFFDTPAICTYSVNMLMVSVFQNNIWDYACQKPEFLKRENIHPLVIRITRIFCNLDMINALIAITLSFFWPGVAFIILFTKLPTMVLARIYFIRKGIQPRPGFEHTGEQQSNRESGVD